MAETLQQLILSLPQYDGVSALRLRTEFRTFTWTYSELSRRVRACAHWLDAHGARRGDRVIFWAPNSPSWVSAYLACLATGAVPVPLDLHSTPDFVESVDAETNARLFLRGRYQPHAHTNAPSFDVDLLDWNTRPGQPESNAWPTLDPDDLAEIMYTSGTTARPKGVMLTHRNLCSNLEGIQPVVPPEPYYHVVSLLPLSHAFEQVIGLLLVLSRGGRITYLQTLKPSALVEAFQREKPNFLVAVPQLLELLRSQVERKLPAPASSALSRFAPLLIGLPEGPRRLIFAPIVARLGGSLRYFVVGGAPLDQSLERYWDGLGILVLQGYGLTEAAPVVSANTPGAHRIGTVGRPLRNVQVRISADGEILVKGPNVTPGYFCHPAETAAALVDGWLRTGDLGFFDSDGFLHLRGRKKDVIVTSAGLKVYPEDVETALNRQPGIRDSAVLEWNGGVHAVLLLDPHVPSRPAEIVARANAQLSPVQRVQSWSIWPASDFPRTPTLKVRKFLVREALVSKVPSVSPIVRPSGKIERIVQDLAPTRQVTPQARLGIDLDLSSIDRLELITLLEEEFHRDIPDVAVSDDTTVADLVNLVQHGAGRGPAAPPRWPLVLGARSVRSAAQRLVIFPALHTIIRLSVEGIENLHRVEEPFILAGNHVSHLDGPLVLMALPPEIRRRTAVAALAGFYFPTSPNPLERAWHWAMFDLAELFFNVFPVPRARGFRESLRHAGYLTEHGWNILIFPEGTRSLSGELTPFREGIGLLASELRVPVIPFRIRGTYQILRRGAWIPRRGAVSLRFGTPLSFPPISYLEITRRIEDAVRHL